MKSRFATCIAAFTVFASAAMPVRLTARDGQERNRKHYHYELIDMGTLGGPVSTFPSLSNRGVVAGWSATPNPLTQTSNPFICGGIDGLAPFITVAYKFENGAVTDLGALPGSSNCSIPFGVNDRGEIVGASENGQVDPLMSVNQQRAVLWKDGMITDLGSLGGNQNQALSINNRGQIVGLSQNTIPDPFSLYDFLIRLRVTGTNDGTQTRAVLWQDEQMQELGTLGGPDAWASYINESGQIAGFSYTSSTANAVTGLPPLDPFLWQPPSPSFPDGRMIDLGNFGGAFGFPNGLNNRGQVIGGSSVAAVPGACLFENFNNFQNSNVGCDVFLWNEGRLIDLTTSSVGGSPQSGYGINNSGQIVGGAVFPNAPFDAYIWRNGVATDLGRLPHDCFSEAYAINSRGQVVGDSFSCSGMYNRFHHAFLWEDGRIFDLNNLIPPHSPLRLVAVGPLSEAVAPLNDRGEIAGVGVPAGCSAEFIDFCGHAFLLVPCDENHPDIEGCDYSLVDATAQLPSFEH
jgi:probable HAF family extracellular repeat protein